MSEPYEGGGSVSEGWWCPLVLFGFGIIIIIIMMIGLTIGGN